MRNEKLINKHSLTDWVANYNQNPSTAALTRPTRPVAPLPVFDNIPDALRLTPRWLLWRYTWTDNRWTKKPYKFDGTSASHSKPDTWCSFLDAKTAFNLSQHDDLPYDGIGFVFEDSGDGLTLCGIDIDKAFDSQGYLKPTVHSVLENFSNAYTEITPSGKGLHVIGLANGIPDGKRWKVGEIGFEVYKHNRYFTVTGDIYKRRMSITDIDAEVKSLIAKYKGPDALKPSSSTSAADLIERAEAFTGDLPNWTEKIRAHARLAKIYFDGDISGYPSQSEADLAMCNFLKGLGVNVATAYALIQRLPLYNKKWDREDYIARTLLNNSYDGIDDEEPVTDLQKAAAHPVGKSLIAKSANDWLDASCHQPAPKQLFGDLWCEGDVTILFADTGRGKSPLAVQIADYISSGSITGNFPFPTTTPQKVLYFDFELGTRSFGKRYSTLR